MLVPRVAESMYWAGRYLERAEATARLVKVHTEQHLDLPRAAGTGWAPLLAVTGAVEPFARRHAEPTEDLVVAFLLRDQDHAGSVVSSLARARHNLRTTRALLPREAWEALNRFVLDTAEHAEGCEHRARRRAWTVEVLAGCQRFAGMVASGMSHDGAYHLLRIGTQVERADMTTRVVDVRAGALLRDRPGPPDPYRDLAWRALLRSLSAHQMYRRSTPSAYHGQDIVRFLLQDAEFPRSVEHCLAEIGRSLLELPRHEEAMQACAALVDMVQAGPRSDGEGWDDVGLHRYLHGLQTGLGGLHAALCATYDVGAAVPPPTDGSDGAAAAPERVVTTAVPDVLATA